MATDPLRSWNDGPTKTAIVQFFRRTGGDDGSPPVPAEDRVAVFDNDGTLWCEKPMPVQLDLLLRRLAEMAEAEPELRERQPWKAAYERDYDWLGTAITEHYAGNDTDVQTFGGGRHGRLRGDQRRGRPAPSGRLLAKHPTPDARSRVSIDGLRPDARTAPLPRGQRVLEVHPHTSSWNGAGWHTRTAGCRLGVGSRAGVRELVGRQRGR